MIRAKVAYLIAEDPAAHGVLDAPQETARKVYCTEKSVGQSEIYQARGTGLNPELKLILRHAFEYHMEKIVEYGGIRWNILRTYRDADSLELTIQRETGNAAETEV
jgi:SPP1 family predicted phage head-tail adaptor